jgi:hypothetical protein
MEDIMTMNKAITDVKFKELTQTIEKTQMELQTAEMYLDARTRRLQADLIETKHELQARLEAVETRTEGGNTQAALCTAPILAYPQPGERFIVDTDASNVGIGGVLSQVQNGQERVIAYYSKTLTRHRGITVSRDENFLP